MSNFEKLTKSEIDAYKNKIKNDYKKDAYEKTINSDTLKYDKSIDKNRNDAFERIYKSAMTLAKRRYAFGRNHEIYMSLPEIASIFTKEYVFFKSSVLGNFEETEGKSVFKRFENTEKKTYIERTNSFFEKYGDEQFEGKTMKEYLKEYEDGKITKEDLNYKIQNFKEENEEFLATDYKSRNYESKEAIINDYFTD